MTSVCMHETAIAGNIIDIVTETGRRHPDVEIKRVRVVIGEMIAVVPELLLHAYDSLITDTPLQYSSLDLTIIPVTANCSQCDASFGIDEFEFTCPFCQSSSIQLTSGHEFYVKEVEVEPCPS
ncbi:MAG: hydrogenase maturation nickel metallochaperone HypA [candidate division KSB1 bacterium]|nr:hydrogenase maturation nickel metallochaperone HypA [candidate division KSB1 bacterium]